MKNPPLQTLVRRNLYWRWSMAVGALEISLPEQPMTDEDVDEMERIMGMAVRLFRKLAKRNAGMDYVI